MGNTERTSATVTPVRVTIRLQWHFLVPKRTFSFEKSSDTLTVRLCDTFAPPRQCHCNRSSLYVFLCALCRKEWERGLPRALEWNRVTFHSTASNGLLLFDNGLGVATWRLSVRSKSNSKYALDRLSTQKHHPEKHSCVGAVALRAWGKLVPSMFCLFAVSVLQGYS